MSLKDLFKNQESFKVSSLKSSDEVGREVGESSEFVVEFEKNRDRFIPFVDYNIPANFARYGLAEKYYEDAIKRIYQTYPYDGSRREKLEWHNSSSYIEEYIFQNEYPRTNGHAIFSADGFNSAKEINGASGYGKTNSAEYILIYGGPNTGSTSMDNLQAGFSGSNIYDADSNRQSNLEYDLDSGTTVEFWLKKEAFETGDNTEKEVIFDLWNGHNSSSVDYGRLRIELDGEASGTPFLITAMSGTSGFFQSSIGNNLTISSITDWNHYAFSFINGPNNVTASLYVNGQLNHINTSLSNSPLNEVTGALKAHIGSLIEAPSGSDGVYHTVITPANVYGKLSASLDEFRYWKVARSSEDIGRYWFTQVNGGTNTDHSKYDEDNPVDLGVYFKFNEGITTNTAIDAVVLDYSGRYTNGSWTGYGSNSRRIGSAMVSASAAEMEFKDPILYPSHPEVDNYLTEKKLTGSAHDVQNNSALYNMLPRWVLDEDAESGGNIKHLTQILASYFDTLHLQIKSLPTLKEATYSTYASASISGSAAKPLPFADRLLEDLGLEAPELFIDSKIIEKLASRDEKREFEIDLHDIKNLIYHNIYNNLSYIYKSKGTEKSFRNLIRCFGVDDELIKLNIYGNEADFRFRDNFKSTVIRKSVVDFNDPSRFGGTVYQYPEGTAELGYISGLNGVIEDLSYTVEAEVIFPKKKTPSDINYFNTGFITSSLFGMHGVKSTSAGGEDTTWYDPAVDTFVDNPNFQVYAIRTSSLGADQDTKDAYFMLTSSTPFPFSALTSSIFNDVYDNNKWNFAVKLRHDKHDQVNAVLGTTGSEFNPSTGLRDANDSYTVEFYGVNTILDEVVNEFVVSSSVRVDLAQLAMQSNKRMYVGSHRTNFTGAILEHADTKVSSLRFWQKHLDNEVVVAHAKDPTNFGLKHPYRNLSVFHSGTNNVYTPSIESLALAWDFETVTGSDPNGRFDVLDFSSGSEDLANGRYQDIGLITKRRHPGRGEFFVASTTASIDKNYFHIAKQQLPEFIYSSDMINIVDEDSVTFTRESRPTQFFFAAEKSMYQTISEEMINMFATIVDFNNLIGETVNRYRPDYKDLTKLRQLFFEKIDNTVDLDKYVDYYKWLDRSITVIIEQLMPASANISDDLRTMVESHVLERNKHFNKIPRLVTRDSDFILEAIPAPPMREVKPTDEEPTGLGISSVGPGRIVSSVQSDSAVFALKDWRFNSAPLPASPLREYEHSSWWKYRAERSHPSITSGDADVDHARDKILSASSNSMSALRRLGSAVKPSFLGEFAIHGGVNYSPDKKIRYAHQATTEFGPTTVFTAGPFSITASNNFVLFRKIDIDDFIHSTDKAIPDELYKRKYRFSAYNNTELNNDYNILKGSTVVPFNLYKHLNVLSGGYHEQINDNFKEGLDITNYHVDTYGPDNEVPMQGPFTEKHVGGLQHRHVDINKFIASNNTSNNLDDDSTRPEALYILIGSLTPGEEAVGIVGPTYTTTGKYDKDTPRARYYRGLLAKSSVNIRNILTSGSKLGNYSNTREYVNTVGRTENNFFFKENSGVSLPSRHAVDLPKTTNVHSLVGVAASTEGNIVGPSSTNLNNTSNRVASDTEFTLPRRDLTGSNSVIVSRFSAPGGSEIMSRGFLDIIAEEHSVYNALPFRNLSVRASSSGEPNSIRSELLAGVGQDGLQTLLTRHQGQFGVDSQHGSIRINDYNTVPSFHKVHRNTIKRIKQDADLNSNELPGPSFSVAIATASVFDNYWVQHPIPRNDLQYWWLTSSFVSYPEYAITFGHAPADGFVSSSVEGVVPAYNFASASNVTNSDGVPVAFTAHNTYLVDGINSKDNLLSASNFPAGYLSGLGTVTSTPEAVHGITLLRHGAYGYPSWKQIRTGENQLVRYQKKRNILSITTPAKEAFTSDETEAITPERKAGKLRQFVQPPITSKHKPIVHVLQTINLSNPFDYNSVDPNRGRTDSGYKYTFANNKEMFPIDEVNYILNINNNTRGVYDELTDLYLASAVKDPSSLGTQLKLVSYSETIYPQPENTYLSGSRSRVTFDNLQMEVSEEDPAMGALAGQLWRSSQKDRTVEEDSNSQNQDIEKLSEWPLDARDDFATANVSVPGTGSGTGELQNLYTIFHGGSNLGASFGSTKSVKFGRRSFLTASQEHSTGSGGPNFLSSSAISFWFKSEDPTHNVSSSIISRGRKYPSTAGDGEAMSFDIRLEGNNLRYNVGEVRGGTNEGKDDGLNLSDNRWHHVLFAWYYKNGSERKYQAFVDGNRTAYGTIETGSGPSSGPGSYVVVGGNPPDESGVYSNQAATIGFKGFIDELTIFTGSLSSSAGDSGTTIGGFSGSIATTLYNGGNPTDVVNSTELGPLTVVSHYKMGEHASDGPLAKTSGFIQDTSTAGLVAANVGLTGNLSASVSNYKRNGFSNTGEGIVTDAPFTAGSSGANTNVYGALYSRQVPERDPDGREIDLYAGDTLWEAADQSGKEPMYDSYDDFREQFRSTAKDYTIIPEFRISNHIDFYLDAKKGNFLADNKHWLQLEGGAYNKTSSSETDFFKTYSNTDFMSLFDVVKQDHSESGYKPTNFTLRCNAIIKFLPYDGFWPAVRTIHLASLASRSFGPRLGFASDTFKSNAILFGTQHSLRTFFTPLFSPGVLYNSIKSGLAVDYPIHTSSFKVAQPSFDVTSETSGSYRISSSFGERIPFEALVEPENYLAGVTIVDSECHISATLDSTASWDGTGQPFFKLAMNNFVAEVPNFFLKGAGVTSLISAKDDDRRHFKAEAGLEYRMRVVLRNGKVSRRGQLLARDNSGGQNLTITGSTVTEPTITMYSRRSAFGPPVHANYIKYNESYEPYTPPYMDGYADVEMVFRPTESKYFTIDEIVSNITSSFFRVGEQYFGDGVFPRSTAVKNQMQISSSCNLLDIVRTKKVIYDPDTGEAVLVEDDSGAPSVAIIQPKWECPILDFENVSVTLPTHGSGSVSKGMWHQYGSESTATDGVFLEVQDIGIEEKSNPALTGSLADLMGFAKTATKLGQVADEKIVREAVVAIPFVEKNGKKEFFNIPQKQISQAVRSIRKNTDPGPEVGQSILEMVERMQRYVFPPKFDFLTNPTVKPVAMYIFEFEHTFSRQDLIDMWQNLSPEIGNKFEAKSVIASHRLSKNELMDGQISDNLRWMVFKVKQKALDNYFEMLNTSVKEEGFDFTLEKGITKNKNDFDYSYNWPYDYFSLVELVKMDAEIVIENNDVEE